jgi:hypothetical protein
MPNKCQHPLSGSGTSQNGRLLQALVPANLRLDPREMEHLMVYAAKMSRYIHFWDYEEAHNRDFINGNWSDFWDNDPLFLLAGIAALDTVSLEKAHKQLETKVIALLTFVPEDDCDVDPRPIAIRNLIDFIFNLASRLNDWGDKTAGHPDLHAELAQMVRSALSKTLVQLAQYDNGTTGAVNDYSAFFADVSHTPFAKNWGLNYLDYTQLDPIATIDEDNIIDGDMVLPLRAIFKQFLKVLIRLRARARIYLDEAKNGEHQHQPHIALFLSFLHLFKHLQNQLNGLTEKHLDHYYGEILQIEKRAASPDKAHLVFQLALGLLRDRLVAGTLFRAGKDSAGNDLMYVLERDLAINQGQVAEIKTLYLNGDDDRQTEIVTAHWERVLDTDKNTEAPDKIEAIQPFHSLGKGEGNFAPIGFAIASCQFETSQANRQFDLLIECNAISPASILSETFTNFASNLWERIAGSGTDIATKWNDYKDQISAYFANFFKIEISTEKGWEEIVDIELHFNQTPSDQLTYRYYEEQLAFANGGRGNLVSPDEKKAIVSIELQTVTEGNNPATAVNPPMVVPFIAIILRIGKKHPAIAALAKPDGRLSADQPVLKIGLNEAHPFNAAEYEFLYTFVKQLEVNLIGIVVHAKNVTNFTLLDGSSRSPLPNNENLDINRLSAGGVYLYSDEIFNKQVYSGKFQEGYNRYANTKGLIVAQQNIHFNLTSKLGSPVIDAKTVYVDGNKIEVQKRQTIEFEEILAAEFDETAEDIGIVEAKRKNIFSRKADARSNDRYMWIGFESPSPGQNGAPPPTIGDLEVDYSSSQVIFQAEPFPVIYQDKIHKDLIVDYRRYDDDLDHFFYIGPDNSYWELKSLHHITAQPDWGITTFNRKQDGGVPELVPSTIKVDLKSPFPLFPTNRYYPNFRRPLPIVGTPNWANGNLFIGMKDLRPEQMLSLLFQVAEGTEEDYVSETPEVEWSYLSNNEWKRFPPGAVSFDSTRGDENSLRSLVQSGIVELQIPADASNQDSLIKPGFIWIRASAVEREGESVLALPKLEAIYAQAGRVRLFTEPVADDHFAAPLPPKTISQLQIRRAAVRKIEQRFPGFNGRAPENALAWYTRVSERLRHKQRAITLWDYERIALEKFPALRAVKCVNHSHYEGAAINDEFSNGHVTVVILPYLTNRAVQNPLQPHPRAGLLEAVRGTLRSCANHFVGVLEQTDSAYLHVVRPEFQEVVVSLSVRFKAGLTDTETWKLRLDEDISRFIAPWAFDDAPAPDFSRHIRRTDMLYFLENLDYVDIVEDLILGLLKRTRDDDNKVIRQIIEFEESSQFFKIIVPWSAKSLLTAFTRPGDNNPVPVEVEDFTSIGLRLKFDPHNQVRSLEENGLVEPFEDNRAGTPVTNYRILPKTPFRTNHLIHVL